MMFEHMNFIYPYNHLTRLVETLNYWIINLIKNTHFCKGIYRQDWQKSWKNLEL